MVPALLGAAREIAAANGCDQVDVMRISTFAGRAVADLVWEPTEAELRARHLWFANLNTPEEFADASGSCQRSEDDDR